MMKPIMTSVLLLLAVSRAIYTQDTMTVIKADFIETEFIPGKDKVPTVRSEGTYFIASDGRHRIERTTNGVRSVEIINFVGKTHIILDEQKKLATIGSTSTVMIPNVKIVPAPPAPPSNVPQLRRDLGTKTIGRLTLRGTLLSGPGPTGDMQTHELWDYRFSDPHMIPILLERRIDSPDLVADQHLVNVSTVQAPPSIFEIPADFKRQDVISGVP